MEMTAIDPVKIDRELNSNGYLIIHDPEIAQLSERARTEYDRCLRASKLHATREKFHYSVLAKQPWRKLAIGGSNGLGYQYAQNLQSIYFDANDENYPALGALFGFMVLVRNKLMGVAPDFGSNPERDRFWNACRVHHYPRGGGFMATHQDTHFPQVIDAQIGKPFIRCVLLSRKNVDFLRRRRGSTATRRRWTSKPKAASAPWCSSTDAPITVSKMSTSIRSLTSTGPTAGSPRS